MKCEMKAQIIGFSENKFLINVAATQKEGGLFSFSG
jgi:hypothetical protein